MNGVVTQSFGINLNVMSAFGLYCRKKSNCSYKIRAYLLYLAFTFPIPLLGTLYFIVEEEFGKIALDENAFLIVQIGCQITKLLPFIRNGKRIKKCINYFESPFFAVKRSNQEEIINKCIRTCRRNSRIFLTFVIGCDVFWAMRPFFGDELKLPVDVWLPYSPTTSQPQMFFLIYFFLVLCAVYTSMACAAIDPLIGGLACLAAGQLKVLKDNLQNISKYVEEEVTEKRNISRTKIMQTKIKSCINHHNLILKFADEYEACFSFAVFSQFLGSILVICFCCLQLSKVKLMSFNFFSVTILLSTFLIEIYVYCYYGTILFEEVKKLMKQSNTLTNATYMGTWYDYDIEAKKSLIILMERSKKPILITAGKVVDISVETFTTILRRSYSLLAVLKNQ